MVAQDFVHPSDTVRFPDVEVNAAPTPKLIEPLIVIAPDPPLNVPASCAKLLAPTVSVLERELVIVFEYPTSISIPPTDPAYASSIVDAFVFVPLNVATSPAPGHASGPSQLAQVLQRLSAPPPSQVLTAACALCAVPKNMRITTKNPKRCHLLKLRYSIEFIIFFRSKD